MSGRLPAFSLLDAGKLPVAQLARIAMREGVRPRAAYQAHKWFARRFAITARALLVAAIAEPTDRFWKLFYQGDSWSGCTVLDPFVGGGVMLLEAARLGADVQGVDIEPVAAAIANFQTKLRTLPELTATLENLTQRVGHDLARFYATQDMAGKKETLLHAFWVQQVTCKVCGERIAAHPTFRFAWDEARRVQWVACKRCSHVIEAASGAKSVSCACGVKTSTASGHLHKGELCCPACGATERLIEVARRSKRFPKFRLFAVETLPFGDGTRHATSLRRIRTASQFDQECYRAAERRLTKLLHQHPRLLPRGKIPIRGRSDNRLVDYGYKDYRELFNARQRLHLALLGREVSRLKGPVRTAAAVAFSDHLTTNNMMCGYAGAWRRLTPIFSIRAYRHIPRPVEINPWLRRNGRGTFPNAMRSVARAAEALRNPAEPTPRGSVRAVQDAHSGQSRVLCGDARRLRSIKSESIDLVLTDPPYFDYIPYSELGHFFAPWFARFGLITGKQAKGFPRGQLASLGRSSDAAKIFVKNLSAAFREIRRVCRPGGRVVFTYQNLDGLGWRAIAQAMASAGIVPTMTFPLFGDSSASLHKQAHSISWDSVLVCRPGDPVPRFRLSKGATKAGRRHASRWAAKLRSCNLQLTDGDQVSIAYAAAIVAEFSARNPAKRKKAVSA